MFPGQDNKLFSFMKSPVLLFLMTFCCPAWASDAMQFKIAPASAEQDFVRQFVRHGQYEIFAFGEIDSGAAARLELFVKENSIDTAVVIFNSPGGSLLGGLRLGSMIRKLRFDAAIGSDGAGGSRVFSGICASSCAYAFAGGVYRFFNDGNEKLGIHQFYSSDQNVGDIGDAQIVSSTLIDYLQTMGVDAKAFIVASSARGNEMFWLTQEQAVQLGFANNGSDQTTVEIKMYGLTPYLKVEQSHSDGMSRVLFNCDSHSIILLAGIVTTPSLSREKRRSLVRSYLEVTPGGEILEKKGDSFTSAEGSVLWLHRMVSPSDLAALLKADELGIWTENGGSMRWGVMIDLRPAKDKMLYFANNCLLAK